MEYNIKMVRANALDYGVPQKRKRVFFIASRKKFNENEHNKTHFDPLKENLFYWNQKPYESVKKFIQEFDKNIFKEDGEETTNGTYYKELKKV